MYKYMYIYTHGTVYIVRYMGYAHMYIKPRLSHSYMYMYIQNTQKSKCKIPDLLTVHVFP